MAIESIAASADVLVRFLLEHAADALNKIFGITVSFIKNFDEYIVELVLGSISSWLYLSQIRERARFKELIRDRAIDWARDASSAMARAHGLLRRMAHNAPPSVAEALDVQAEISALIDQGRLYFPNHFGHEFPDWPHWKDKPAARKGYRDPILDMLVVVHDELKLATTWLEQTQRSQPGATEYEQALKELPVAANHGQRNVFEARSQFTSEVQKWMGLRERGIGRHQAPLRKAKPTAIEWSAGIAQVVDDFESRAGRGKLWSERPCSRKDFVKKYRAFRPGWLAKVLRSGFWRRTERQPSTVQ